MARETFISYKYSEAKALRDEIINQLGDDANYYRGETSTSPNLVSTTVNNIKNNLKEMIYGTSVTIVIVSPNMLHSEWMEWEIEYSLKEITRQDRTSRTNGILGVVMKVNGSYDWLISRRMSQDGCFSRYIDKNYLFEILNRNRYNLRTDDRYYCATCQSYDRLTGSYFSLIDQDEFLSDPNKYIENAYEKATNLWKYKICKES
ncbi:TIR domain-containing protein [Chryseobacterium paludis]|uniref:TIR domain-containing protein n=1 Tax=Chryseobacterium paludis TaxID=2956784 RepID=UPI0021C0E5BE|nr:TIR domain-containing protein [Chryseobacterium paludis]